MREKVALATGAGVALLLATDVVPGVRGPENWQWARRPLNPCGWWTLLPVLFLAQIGVAFRIRSVWATGANRVRVPWLLAAVALTFGQMVLLTAIEPGGLTNVPRRVMDPSFTSYHTIARNVDDVGDFLTRYPRLQKSFPVHGPSQPPGRVLFFRAINEWAGASAARTEWILGVGERLGGVPSGPPGTTDGQRAGALVAGFLLMVIGSATLIPLVVVVGGRCHATAVGAAVLLAGVLPSFVLFTPQTDHLILFLTVTSAALLVEAMRYASRPGVEWLSFASGLTAGAALFVSFTTLAALGSWGLALLGMLLFGTRRRVPLPGRGRTVRLGVAALAGISLPILLAALAGMDWLAVFRECVASAHRVQVLIHGREFSTWVAWNLWDFALFAGWPLIAMVLARARDEVSEWRTVRGGTAAPGAAVPLLEIPFALALLTALVALDLSGRILGETGRIWMFLMPLGVAAASVSYGHVSLRRVLPVAAGQWLVLVALRLFVNVPG